MKSNALWLAATGGGVLPKLSNASKPLVICAPFEEEKGSSPPIKSNPDGAALLVLGAGAEGGVGSKASKRRLGALVEAGLASARCARFSELPKGLVLLNGSAPQAPAALAAGLAPPALEYAGLALAVPELSRA
jgi:hypothetical protein